MGWTLFACFGYTKKRKRPKGASKLNSKSKRRSRNRGYEPLQTDEFLEVLESSEPLSSPREKSKDEAKPRIRKKVRFNLDVVTYEPLSSQDDDELDNWEETERAYAPLSKTISSAESKLPLYPSDHRYNNCYDGEDEYEDDEDEDEDYDEDSQISDDEDDGYENVDPGCAYDSQKLYYEEIEGEVRDCSSIPLISTATNARQRSHYIVPVLNPIENISQWKAVKIRKC